MSNETEIKKTNARSKTTVPKLISSTIRTNVNFVNEGKIKNFSLPPKKRLSKLNLTEMMNKFREVLSAAVVDTSARDVIYGVNLFGSRGNIDALRILSRPR